MGVALCPSSSRCGAASRAPLSVLSPLVAAGALAQSPPAAAPRPGAQQQTDPQQIRQELDRLRQEFEAIRESYGARLAALEAKLGVAPAAPPRHRRAPPAARRRPPPARLTCRPGPPAPADRKVALPVYGNAAASSKIFNPDIAVIGNFLGAAGKNDVDPPPGARDARGRGLASRRSSIRTRAPTSSWRRRPKGSRSRRASSPSRRCPAACCEGRQDAGAVRQGEHDAHPRAAVGGRAARDDATCSAAKRASPTPASRSRGCS